jgi:hypothetical protein
MTSLKVSTMASPEPLDSGVSCGQMSPAPAGRERCRQLGQATIGDLADES